ncbi:MAG: RagB/SusD family nutrient uptake outer membrane protein [Paludibacteraceae bacterium]|nr:RagB/SusD family nutrient uptake outer membrane protein [Paludibacteraceae bacterium]
MKILNIKSLALAALLMVGATSCEDFLNRPTMDNYTIDGFYQTDEQCFQAVNPIYNSPWYDFQRGFVKIGDVLAGNIFYGTDNGYQAFILKSSDDDLRNASASLWSVNAYCNTLIENLNLKAGPKVSKTTLNTVKGEALTWKAMTYFYLVRIWGAVPIIHNNSEIIANNNSNSIYKNRVEDVYTYIVKTLEQAIDLLPEENQPGRIDKYAAMGLMAKVYLTKSGYGQSGTRVQADLEKAAYYANEVIEKSGRILTPEYSDIFRLKNNISDESLISWRWTVGAQWTCQNSLQSDLGLNGFSEFADTWGTWAGITIDLQNLFGEDATNKTTRINNDDRRKATMMMLGDKYEYFWSDKGGFTYNWVNGDITYGVGTGSNVVKHLVGNNNDHVIGIGSGMDRMATSLATHILRLADVYLVYAEAVLGNGASTSDAKALAAFNAVRSRSINGVSPKTSITFDDIFNERRKELACEGDNWYDFVRLSYYNPELAKDKLAAQERGSWNNIDAYYKGEAEASTVTLGSWKVVRSNIVFTIPFPDTDLAANPRLSEDPVAFDFSSIGY